MGRRHRRSTVAMGHAALANPGAPTPTPRRMRRHDAGRDRGRTSGGGPAGRVGSLRARWPARRSTPARKPSAFPTTCASTRWRAPAVRRTRRCRALPPPTARAPTTPPEAQKGPDGSPVNNAARDIWVTETALTTALYTSYFAENVTLFSIIVGIALLLVGHRLSSCSAIFARRRTPDTTAAQPSTAVAT